MKKINENIKLIIVLIMAIVISSMISIKAATTLSSSSVYYDTSKSGGTSSNVNGAIDELYSLTTDREKLKQDILDLTWPVGSVYISTTDSSVESVQERFGGTWVKYSNGTTLVGDDGTNYITNDETKGSGGSSAVVLTNENMPEHSHVIPALSGKAASTTSTWMAYSPADGSSNEYGGTNTTSANTSLGKSLYGSGGSYFWNIRFTNKHTHTVTTTESNTTTCTNCSSTPINVQNPYTVVYMYKRIA